LKDTLFIITFGLLAYLGFATLLGDTSLMGSYGAKFAQFNHTYFGYVSYVYIFIALIPIYVFYKNSTLTLRKFELFITSFLVLFSSLLAQALLVDDELRGSIGGDFVDFLSRDCVKIHKISIIYFF
jgi:S-DNA-T family DNA segregation ATPase FtsK/SpoIIIE